MSKKNKKCKCGLEKGHDGPCKTGKKTRKKPAWQVLLEKLNPPQKG